MSSRPTSCLDHNPLVILSTAQASALLSVPASRHLTRGRHMTTSSSALCPPRWRPPAACPEPAGGVGTGLARPGCRAPGRRAGDQRREGHRGTWRGGGAPAVVERRRASPHRGLGCRPATADGHGSRRGRQTWPSRGERARAIPGGGV